MTACERILVFCFLVENTTSEKYIYTKQITSTWQICPDVAFVDRNKEYTQQQDEGQFHTYYRVWVVLIIETLLLMWNIKQQ
jgi:hypothetical protein